MKDLSEIAGFPLLFDPETLEIAFDSEMAETQYSCRKAIDLLPVLHVGDLSATPDVLYHMYRNVRYPEMKHQEMYGLRYDLSVFKPGRVGDEPMKSLGHYHPLIPGTAHYYPEIYEVLYGEALFLMQKVSPVEPALVESFMYCTVAAGEKIVMPSGYGHVTINRGDTPLITTNWVSDRFSSRYQPVVRMRGFGWYLTDSGWVENNNYINHPEPVAVRYSDPFSYCPLFTLGLREVDSLAFLNDGIADISFTKED
jgi:oxalate decarboxylase/phosphoglucose isomerase-like protein (cupin superfamily)